MTYNVIGLNTAPSFFFVGSNGEIFSRGTLRSDRDMQYIVSTLCILQNTAAAKFCFKDNLKLLRPLLLLRPLVSVPKCISQCKLVSLMRMRPVHY